MTIKKNTTNFAEIVSRLTELSDKQFTAAIRCAKQQRRATRTLEAELIRQKRAKLPAKSTNNDKIGGLDYELAA